MTLSIRNNILADAATRHLAGHNNRLSNSIERLSSGLRVNKAADDSSGMMIADSLSSQARGIGQAIKNANDAISIVQIADAALEESVNILNTIKVKSIQAAQDGQTTDSRQALQSDIDRLLEELDQIASTTSFNGQKLLSGNFINKSFQIGAYSNEVIDLSIDAASSAKIGHQTRSTLEIADNKEGIVALSLQNKYSGETYDVIPVDLAFDNDPAHGLAALASNINQISDLTGIRASARVSASTAHPIQAGTTGQDFSINLINIGALRVTENDADGTLVKAINSKTTQHGVTASVDSNGSLTLTATDGRGIIVDPGTDPEQGLSTILGGSDLTTFGTLETWSDGTGAPQIRDLSRGKPVAVADKSIQTRTDTLTQQDGLLTAGSVLTRFSIIRSPWTLDQTVTGDQFEQPVSITETTRILTGTVLGKDSAVLTQDQLPVTLRVNSTGATTSESTIKTGSILGKGSILGVGTLIPAGNIVSAGTLYKGDVPIDATAATTAPSLLKVDSVMATNSVIASGSILAGTATINATGALQSGALITPGSIIRTNSWIASGTTLGGNATIAGIPSTSGIYSLTAGSSLANNSILASGTILGGDAWTQFIPSMTSTYDIAGGSFLQAGSIISSGTVLSTTATVSTPGLITGNFNLLSGSLLRPNSRLGPSTNLTNPATLQPTGALTGDLTVETGSSLATGTHFGDGTILHGSGIIDPIAASSNPGDTMTLAAGTSLAAGTYIAAGEIVTTTGGNLSGPLTLVGPGPWITSGINVFNLESGSIAGGSKLAADSVAGALGFTLQNPSITTALTTLKSGSSLGGGSSLATGSVIGPDTVRLSVLMNVNNPMTLTAGSSIAGNSSLIQGTTIGPGGVTLSSSLTLGGGPMTLTSGSTVAFGSRLDQGSVAGAQGITLASIMSLAADMDLPIGSRISASSTLNTGSVVGANNAQLSANLDVDAVMDLKAGSIIAGSSSLSQNSQVRADAVTLAADMTLATDMTLETGSSMGRNTEIKYGSYLWADATMLSSMALQEDVTLASEMTLNSDLILGEGSSLGEHSLIFQGSSIYLPLILEESAGIPVTLTLDPGSVLSNNPDTIIPPGTWVGGDAELAASLVLKNDFLLTAGSLINSGSKLQNGSDISGDIQLAEPETISDPMGIGQGSILATGTVIAKGTLLTTTMEGIDGRHYPEGTFLEENLVIRETGLEHAMTLMPGSQLAQDSILAVNTAQNHTQTRLTGSQSTSLAQVRVLSQDEAQAAISLADQAVKDLDRIRSDLGAVHNQLASTISSISTAQVNLHASASAIIDLDFAEEVHNMTQMDILAKAGQFALSMAPDRTENLISLLSGMEGG